MIAKTMLFRPGSAIVIWGISLDTVEIEEHDVADYLADGWYDHPFKARDAAEAATASKEAELAKNAKLLEDADKPKDADADLVIKTQLAEEAIALGITIDGRWSATRLQKEIEAKKAE